MEIKNLANLLSNNSYPGRGIVLGKTPNGKCSAVAYFIMGRSENSRNRILRKMTAVVYAQRLLTNQK